MLAVTLTASSSNHETEKKKQRLTCESHNFVGSRTRMFLEHEINLTFIGPCIANILAEYNQQDATFLNLIFFCKTLYMFQKGFPSIVGSSKLHTQRQVLV